MHLISKILILIRQPRAWLVLCLLWVQFTMPLNLYAATDPPKTACPVEDNTANDLLHQAKTITRADYNPRTKDYAEAARLYTQAAKRYDLLLAQLSHPLPGSSEALSCDAATLDRLAERIRKIRFTAYQTQNMARYRARRGLL